MKHINHNQQLNRGAALTFAVLFFALIASAVVLGSATPVLRDFKNGQGLIQSKNSYFASEAGVEDVFYRLKTSKQVSNPEVVTLNGGTASITSTNVSSSEKEILSEGAVNSRDRNVKLSLITGIGSDFAYSAQVGEGGLVMGNNSRVLGVGGAQGNVFTNGPIQGSNGATITGDAFVATSLVEDTAARSLVCNTDQTVGATSPQIDFAQSFVAGDTLPLARVSLYVKKVGTPSSPSVKIVANASGSPATSALASGTLLVGNVTGTYGWVDVSFSSPAQLTQGSTYWIVIDMNANTSNYYVWCRDAENGYAGGTAKYKSSWSTGGSWTAVAGDLGFKTYLGSGNGSIAGVSVNGSAHANSITGSTIGGTAYCQSGSGNNKSCNTSQADPTSLNMPLSDGNIQQMKDDAAAGGTITGNCGDSGVAGCAIPENGTLSLGPKKITGNLVVTNNKTLKLTGALYVMGNVTIGNNGLVKCDISYGADSCYLITDGYVEASNNALFSGSGQSGSYILIVSDKVGCLGSSGTGCASGYSGINLANNLGGAIFYASKSMINLSNNAVIKAVVGYKLNLANNAEIQYEQGVMDTNFSSGPGGAWNVKTWKEVE